MDEHAFPPTGFLRLGSANVTVVYEIITIFVLRLKSFHYMCILEFYGKMVITRYGRKVRRHFSYQKKVTRC